jgi:hypothetical protein
MSSFDFSFRFSPTTSHARYASVPAQNPLTATAIKDAEKLVKKLNESELSPLLEPSALTRGNLYRDELSRSKLEALLATFLGRDRSFDTRTPFSTILYNLLAVHQRRLIGIQYQEDINRRTFASKQKRNTAAKAKKPSNKAPLSVVLGVKTGLSLLFAVLRQSQRSGDTQLIQELYSTAIETLAELPAMSLTGELSSLTEDCIERITQHLLAATRDTANPTRVLAFSVLLSIVAHRASAFELLQCVHTLFSDAQLQLSTSLVHSIASIIEAQAQALVAEGDQVHSFACDQYIEQFAAHHQENASAEFAASKAALATLAHLDRMASLRIAAVTLVSKDQAAVDFDDDPVVLMCGSRGCNQLAESSNANAVVPIRTESLIALQPQQVSTIITVLSPLPLCLCLSDLWNHIGFRSFAVRIARIC